MFSLRDTSSVNSLDTDENSFGWWIGVESHSQAAMETKAPNQNPTSMPRSTTGLPAISNDVPGAGYTLNNDLNNAPSATSSPGAGGPGEDADEESDSTTDRERRGLCYTPERLVQSLEYRILAAPARLLYPSLTDILLTARSWHSTRASGRRSGERRPFACSPLRSKRRSPTDGRRAGASHLAALLQRSHDGAEASCSCRVRYVDGEVLLHSETCPDGTSYNPPVDSAEPSPPIQGHPDQPFASPEFGPHCVSSSRLDLRSWPEGHDSEDTSGVSSGDEDTCIADLSSPDEAAHSTRLSSLAYASLEGPQGPPGDHQARLWSKFDRYGQTQETKPLVNEVVSILANLEKDPRRAEELLADTDRFQDATQSSHDSLTRLALSIEHDGKDLPSPELELDRLRIRLDDLKDYNRHLYQEISSLRRDFTEDEWRVNNLSEEINKLQNEVNEQRFLDDLLKLLNGKIEQISNKNWPFAIGHTKQETEEINLVV